ILDVVPNHTANVRQYPEGTTEFSDERIEGVTFREGVPLPLPAELRRDEAFHDQGPLFNWNDREESLNGDFLGGLSDLNTEDPATVRAIIDQYKYWIAEFDIDGFRVDAVKHAPPEFWDQFNREILEFAHSLG